MTCFQSFRGLSPNPSIPSVGKGEISTNALKAWQAGAIQLALTEGLPPFSRDELSEDFIHQVVKLRY
jgi:hypothetical protein